MSGRNSTQKIQNTISDVPTNSTLVLGDSSSAQAYIDTLADAISDFASAVGLIKEQVDNIGSTRDGKRHRHQLERNFKSIRGRQRSIEEQLQQWATDRPAQVRQSRIARMQIDKLQSTFEDEKDHLAVLFLRAQVKTRTIPLQTLQSKDVSPSSSCSSSPYSSEDESGRHNSMKFSLGLRPAPTASVLLLETQWEQTQPVYSTRRSPTILTQRKALPLNSSPSTSMPVLLTMQPLDLPSTKKDNSVQKWFNNLFKNNNNNKKSDTVPSPAASFSSFSSLSEEVSDSTVATDLVLSRYSSPQPVSQLQLQELQLLKKTKRQRLVVGAVSGAVAGAVLVGGVGAVVLAVAAGPALAVGSIALVGVAKLVGFGGAGAVAGAVGGAGIAKGINRKGSPSRDSTALRFGEAQLSVDAAESVSVV